MDPETFALIFVICFVLVIVITLVYFIAKPASRRKGSFNAVTFYGATADLLTKDKKEAIEHVLDVQAEKKMQEQESGEPDEK
jgi:hypothetical protein